MKKYQGHYGLEFVLMNGHEAIEAAARKLERHPNRLDPQVRRISISDPERKQLAVLQREKAKIRQVGIEKMRQRYMK